MVMSTLIELKELAESTGDYPPFVEIAKWALDRIEQQDARIVELEYLVSTSKVIVDGQHERIVELESIIDTADFALQERAEQVEAAREMITGFDLVDAFHDARDLLDSNIITDDEWPDDVGKFDHPKLLRWHELIKTVQS